MNGWADLGSMLAGGGGQVYEQAYGQALGRRARTEAALAGARKARDEEAARQELGAALMAGGASPEEAQMLQTMFRGGFDPRKATGSMLEMQRRSLIGEASEALRGGDVDLGNNLLTVVQGRPRERTKISGQVAFDPYAAPDQALNVTDIGQSMIAENEAQATSSLMRGQAAVDRANRPSSTRGTGVNNLGDFMVKEEIKRINAMADQALVQTGADPVAIERERQQRLREVMGVVPEAPQATGLPEGAKQAPDGNWYVPDPNRPGKWLMVQQ